MRKLLALIIISGQFTFANAQKDKAVVGFGINSTYYFQPETEDPYIGQGIPQVIITPCLNVRKRAHEFFLGPDFFICDHFPVSSLSVEFSGGQAGYNYHFTRSHKRYNLFLSAELQYSQFKSGGITLSGYNKNDISIGSHTTIFKNRSLISTYGCGFQIKCSKTFYLYTLINAGINYCEKELVLDQSYREYKDINRINFISGGRFGFKIEF